MALTLAPARALLADRAGRAVLFAFAFNSITFGNWVVRIPDVQAQIGLSDAALGIGLLGVPLGSVAAVVLGGRLIDRIGPGHALVLSAIGLSLASVGPTLAASLAVLMVTTVAFGVCNGLMDVAMNAEAVAIEHRLGRRVMATCHGGYSVGGVAGAGVGSLLAGAGLSATLHLALVALVLSAAILAVRGLYLDLPHRQSASRPPTLALPRPPFTGLGLVVALVLIGESAMSDWSALFLRRSLDAGAAAGMGYVAFSATMALGRFFGDGFVDRWGVVPIVRWGLACAAVSLGLILIGGSWPLAILGFGGVGLGLAGIVPAVFRAGAEAPGVSPGVGVASVASAGYAGIMLQPALIGTVSDTWGLSAGLFTVLVALGLAALLCRWAFEAVSTDPAAAGEPTS